MIWTGTELKSYRKRLGYSQKRIAHQLKVDVNTIKVAEAKDKFGPKLKRALAAIEDHSAPEPVPFYDATRSVKDGTKNLKTFLTDCAIRPAYAWTVPDQSMAPLYPKGSVAVILEGEEVGSGHLGLIQINGGETYLRYIQRITKGRVMLSSCNESFAPFEVNQVDIESEHPVYSITSYPNPSSPQTG